MADNNQKCIDDILAKFGNAEYSSEFWARTNANRKRASELYEQHLKEEFIYPHHLDKIFDL